MIILVAVQGDDVAPRFDLTTEVRIAKVHGGRVGKKVRTVLLTSSSGEELCGLIVKENVSVVVCGGIEEEHYQYLTWKSIKVVDGVIGSCGRALESAGKGELEADDILPASDSQGEGI